MVEARRVFGPDGAGLIEHLLLAAREEKNRGIASLVAGLGACRRKATDRLGGLALIR